MKLIPRVLPDRLLISSGLIATGLIAASVGALVALPEHGAGLRSWIGAPLPGRHERVGALQWWVTPIERNALARRFTATENLNDFAVMDDGRTIFVVGDNGTLLKSVNAGTTWRSLTDDVKWRDGTSPDDPDGAASESPPSLPTLRSVAASPDGSLAIAVGVLGTVLTSDNNGETWTERASGSSASLTSVAFDASTKRAIAVGMFSTVLTSDNSGETWTERASGSPAWLSSVAFDASTKRAIAVGEDGTVLTTDNNSGETWTERASGSSAWLRSVAFDASTGRAIAVGEDGTILTSDNSGETWTERASGSSAWLRSVAFDASTGRAIAVGQDGTILTSDNSGETWTERASGSSAWLRSVAFDASTRRAIALGLHGTVLTSDNNGETWTERASGSPAWLSSVAFDASTKRAIAVGEDGTVLTSDNNGETWTERASGSLESLFSVAFDASTGRAIAVGEDGTILTSDNSGETWTERASGSLESLFSVAFDASTKRAIAVGMFSTVLTSDNSGETWTEPAPGSLESLRSVAFDASTRRAIAVGLHGTVLTSDNNGETWTKPAFGSSAWLRSVAFDASTKRAIAVGVRAVLTSDNNGETWTERASGSSASLRSVAFDASTKRAIAVGEDGTVLTSDNNGETWTKRASGSSASLTSVAFDASTKRAIAVGVLGTVITSDDAGATWSIVAQRGRIYPAPLSVLGLLLLSLGGLTLRRYQPTYGSPISRNGIIDLFVSDRPLGLGDPDRLGFGRYAQGLSGLLRNRGTGFPITIAITGEWGAGKSSLMRLLEADLERRRWFLAWFNAWHDQNEENVLSSLLQAIRTQAVPRIFSRRSCRAIELRVKLLYSRGLIYVMAIVVSIILVATVASPVWRDPGSLPSWKEDVRPAIRASIGTYEPFYVTDATVEAACARLKRHGPKSSERLDDCNQQLGGLKASATGTKVWSNSARLREAIERELYLPHPGYTVEVETALLDNVAHVAIPSLWTVFGKLWPELMRWLWQWLTAFAAAVVVIANGASAFGFNLRRGASGFLGAAANSVDPAGRHEQLRRDFKNVSRTIGRNLVIFIDDLDRCQPEKVVETLEAVNFLVTAGECAVVMGLDYQRVQDCVGLVRKELAEAEYAAATREGVEAEGRTAYAHQYLKKLVNVEMPLVAERDRVRELITKPGPPVEKQIMLDWLSRWSTWLRWWWTWLRGLRVWAILVALVAGALFVVPYVHDALVPAEPFEVVGTIQDDKVQPTSKDEQQQSTQAGGLPAPAQDDVERDQTTKPALDTTPDVVFWPVSAGLLLILILGLLLEFRWLHKRGRLKLWGDIVTSFRRLLSRPDDVQDSPAFEKALEIWSKVVVYDNPTPRTLKRFLNRLRYFAAMLRVENGEDFDWRREANLVALATLHHLNFDFPRTATLGQPDLFQHEGANLGVTQNLGGEEDEAVRARIELIHEACQKHACPGSWVVAPGGGGESPWPPDESEFEQFRKLSGGIHV